MSKFDGWCEASEKPVGDHVLTSLTAINRKLAIGQKALVAIIPTHYAADHRLADILKRYGKKRAAKYLREKLPTDKKARSGELGEILAVAYVNEETDYQVPIRRLRWKDHRQMPMRGDDVIALRSNADGRLEVLKGEVKSRATMSKTVIASARKALRANSNRPSPHTLSYIAERLHEIGQHELANRIDDEQFARTIRLSQVEHLIFSISANDASALLEAELKAYKGSVRQRAVALRIEKHAKFISETYEAVV